MYSILKYLVRSLFPQVVQLVKNLPVSAGDTRDAGSIPGLGKFIWVGNGNPLQYSCLENPMDTGTWRATVCGAIKSRAWLSARTRRHAGTHAHTQTHTDTHTHTHFSIPLISLFLSFLISLFELSHFSFFELSWSFLCVYFSVWA